ncbi:MAG: DnaD domain protein [Flavobacteriaceae bacterium]|nr:MAG: DnaD domain protein [Flavobacteriaceae bacterium]
MEKNFPGFSFENEKLTSIPISFFTKALKEVNDLAQLKILLYVFWRHSRSEFPQAYVTFKGFTEDTTFMDGLGKTKASQIESLKHGLKLSVEQNLLLTAMVTIDNKNLDIYLLNTSEGKNIIRAIQIGKWEKTNNESYPIRLDLEFPNVFTLYEENIGPITPLIADALKEIENLYPLIWIEEAFEEAIKNNVRKLRYIEAILQNWQKEGRNDRTDRRRSKKSEKEDDPERYIKGEFSDFIEH